MEMLKYLKYNFIKIATLWRSQIKTNIAKMNTIRYVHAYIVA